MELFGLASLSNSSRKKKIKKKERAWRKVSQNRGLYGKIWIYIPVMGIRDQGWEFLMQLHLCEYYFGLVWGHELTQFEFNLVFIYV